MTGFLKLLTSPSLLDEGLVAEDGLALVAADGDDEHAEEHALHHQDHRVQDARLKAVEERSNTSSENSISSRNVPLLEPSTPRFRLSKVKALMQ